MTYVKPQIGAVLIFIHLYNILISSTVLISRAQLIKRAWAAQYPQGQQLISR